MEYGKWNAMVPRQALIYKEKTKRKEKKEKRKKANFLLVSLMTHSIKGSTDAQKQKEGPHRKEKE